MENFNKAESISNDTTKIIADLRAEHAKEIAELKAKHEEEITELKAKHAEELLKRDAKIEEKDELATKDELTRINNRRGFLEFAEEILYTLPITGEKREETKFKADTFLFLDIDNFKVYNDEYGHDFGDEVLKKTAETLIKNTRRGDIVGRWGGDEFVVIFRGADAQDIVDKFYDKDSKQAKLSFKIKIPNSDKELTVNFSGGVATHKQGESIDSLKKRADEALYESKRLGKGRIIKYKTTEILKNTRK